MNGFKQISPVQLAGNVFERIENDWMLVTTRRGDTVNTMTASWGSFGIMWNKPVAFLFIRPQRFTRELLDASETFSLSFMPAEYRKELAYCGKISGYEEDKIKHCGFTLGAENDCTYIEQSETVILCKKIFRQHMEPEAVVHEENIVNNYSRQDFHYIYAGEITSILVREE